MRWISLLLCACSYGLCTAPAGAQDQPSTAVTLSTGEVLHGAVRAEGQDTLVLTHPVLGDLRIPRASVTLCEPPVPPEPVAPAAQPTAPPETPTSPVDAVLAPDERPFWTGWHRSVSVGLNSSDGTTDAMNGRAVIDLLRETAKMKSDATLAYVYSKDAGGTRKSRLDAGVRNDWMLGTSPWRLFANGLIEYDQFAAWDWRATATAGVGYALVKSEKQEFVARLGAGFSHDFGGPDDKLTPIGVGGLDYSRKMSEHSSLFVNFDYFPDLADFREFRTATKGGYQILLDTSTNMMLRLGAEHRHDSDPGSGEANDIEYYLALGLQF